MNKSSVIGGLCTTLTIATIATSSAFAQGTTSAPAPAAPAAAPTEAAATTSTAKATSTADQIWLEKLKITYVAVFDGPPISALDSKYRSSEGTGYADEGKPLGVRNDLGFYYPVNDKVSFGATMRWSMRVVPEGANTNGLGDPYIALKHGSVLSDGGAFNMPGQIRLGLPWSDGSTKAQRRFYNVGLIVPTYSIPNSPFELSALTIARLDFFKISKGGQNDMGFWMTPAISYQMIPTLGFSLGYNFGGTHEKGQPFSSWNNDGTSLQPGLSWNITKSLILEPSIYIMTGNRVAPDTTLTEVDLTWKLM